jgi:phage terminase small subunit
MDSMEGWSELVLDGLKEQKANYLGTILQATEILQYIQRDWDFMTDGQCVPVQVALQLMDTSSLGRAHQYEQFKETNKQLQTSLKAIVNGIFGCRSIWRLC